MPLRNPQNVAAVFQTLAHHDGRLTELNTRLGGVETAVVAVDKKVGEGFLRMEKALTETSAKQGPGITQIMYGLAAGATVIGIVCSGITMLVGSQFSGPMSQMQTMLTSLADDKKDRDKADAAELLRIKDARTREFEDYKKTMAERLRELETRKEWVPTVRASR